MRIQQETIPYESNESFHVHCYKPLEVCDFNYWHFHPEYEIVYVHNGSGRRVVGNHTSTYTDGELILLGPNIPHLPFGNLQNPDNYEIVIQFGHNLLDQILAFKEFRHLQFLLNRAQYGISFGKKTKMKLASYIGEINEKGSSRIIILLRVLTDLCESEDYEILDRQLLKIKKPHSDFNRLERIYDYVSKRYANEISLDEIAEEVGLTKNSLCRFFKQITGKTINRFIQEYRIAIARDDLREGQFNIGEVAARSGFKDLSFFNKKFKEIAGCTPREYRREFQLLGPMGFPHR